MENMDNKKHQRAKIEEKLMKLNGTQIVSVTDDENTERKCDMNTDSITFTRSHLEKIEYSYKASRVALKACIVWLTIIGLIGIIAFFYAIHL